MSIAVSRSPQANNPTVKVRPLLQRLEKAGTALETTMLVAMLSAMMIVAVGQIIMREVFGTGFGWADELVRLMVLWLAMVGSIAACRDNRHIRIDALSHILPDLSVQFVRIVVDLFAAIVCGIVAVQAWRYLHIEIEYDFAVLVDTPAWIAHVIMPIAFALMAYRFLIDVLKRSSDILSARNAEAEE
jgi:C4-dicarboxylate transporter DctQ subunit